MKYFNRITLVVASAVLVPLAGCASFDTSTRYAPSAANDSRPYDHRYDANRVPDAKYPGPGFYDNRIAHWNDMYQHYE